MYFEIKEVLLKQIQDMGKEISENVYAKSASVLFNSYSTIGTEVLSNLHLCRLEYSGKIFNSSEQLFFWLRLTGYPEHQEQLLQCNTPKDVKRLGEQYMKKLGILDNIERDIQLLRLAIRVKYNCCVEFREYLLSHPAISFVEYAWWGDNTYGCVDVDKRLKYDWTQGEVKGKNICGRIIKGVRDEEKDTNGMCIISHPPCLDEMKSSTLFG